MKILCPRNSISLLKYFVFLFPFLLLCFHNIPFQDQVTLIETNSVKRHSQSSTIKQQTPIIVRTKPKIPPKFLNLTRPYKVGGRKVIARTLGNDLPPLHCPDQTFLNTRYILQNEAMPENFVRLWIVNSIVDPHEKFQLVQLLQSYNETHRVIEADKNSSYRAVLDGLNVNKARNLALTYAFQDMDASWVFLFDGAAFLTAEGLVPLMKLSSGKISIHQFHFTAVYRLLFRLKVTTETELKDILKFTTGQQEVMLGMNREGYMSKVKIGKKFFDENRTYGKADKFNTLWFLKSRSVTHCRDILNGVDQRKRTVDGEVSTINRCGYMLRLVYCPAESAPFNQTLNFLMKGQHRVESISNFYARFNVSML